MRFDTCFNCRVPLQARVAHGEHDEDGNLRVTMTKDTHVFNCHNLPSNEQVIDLWCDMCGAKYMPIE